LPVEPWKGGTAFEAEARRLPPGTAHSDVLAWNLGVAVPASDLDHRSAGPAVRLDLCTTGF